MHTTPLDQVKPLSWDDRVSKINPLDNYRAIKFLAMCTAITLSILGAAGHIQGLPLYTTIIPATLLAPAYDLVKGGHNQKTITANVQKIGIIVSLIMVGLIVGSLSTPDLALSATFIAISTCTLFLELFHCYLETLRNNVLDKISANPHCKAGEIFVRDSEGRNPQRAIFVESCEVDEGDDESGVILNAVSANVALLPGCDRFNKMRPNETRIPDTLAFLENQYRKEIDIVCVQELFCLRGFERLAQCSYKYALGGIEGRGVGSGLAIFSNLKIFETSFTAFPNGTNEDRLLAMKGVQYVKVMLPNGQYGHLFHTHLDNENNREATVRHEQLKFIEQVIGKTRIEKGEKIILLGDFNLNQKNRKLTDSSCRTVNNAQIENSLHKGKLQKLSFTKGEIGSFFNKSHKDWRENEVDADTAEQTLFGYNPDHCFVSDKGEGDTVQVIKRWTVSNRQPIPSDHLPIHATIHL